MGEYYTGFVAEHYDLLVPEDETKSYAFFRSAIEFEGEPALELACGTGRPLLSFVMEGLDVEGLDSSSDMLDRCRTKAAERGVSVRLHEGRMESFEIDRSFRTIYAVSSSFNLLPTPDAMRESLRTIHRHLAPGGRLLLALHTPGELQVAAPSDWQVAREAERPSDGSQIRCLSRIVDFDPDRQTYETLYRYQQITDGRIRYEEDRGFLLHWQSQDQFSALLDGAGYVDIRALRADGKPSAPTDPVFIVAASRGSADRE
jgi:ubiquinone/menaquinone biosynthesis C-methylase UbiE